VNLTTEVIARKYEHCSQGRHDDEGSDVNRLSLEGTYQTKRAGIFGSRMSQFDIITHLVFPAAVLLTTSIDARECSRPDVPC
jgi:hypothetical protein